MFLFGYFTGLKKKCCTQKNAFLGWLNPSIFVKISREHINFPFLHEHLDIYVPFKSLVDHSDLCLSQYEPIKLYHFLLFFIFQAIKPGHHLHTILTIYKLPVVGFQHMHKYLCATYAFRR